MQISEYNTDYFFFHAQGKVKPDIVFFGENLPHAFWDYHLHVPFTDLLLVMGTSLEVTVCLLLIHT